MILSELKSSVLCGCIWICPQCDELKGLKDLRNPVDGFIFAAISFVAQYIERQTKSSFLAFKYKILESELCLLCAALENNFIE